LTDPVDPIATDGQVVDALTFHDALAKRNEIDTRRGRIIELRLLGALTLAEIADVLDISEPTARRDWNSARLWL
jgi:DNA-directed RNA polymerase specialized sigma24 family protein